MQWHRLQPFEAEVIQGWILRDDQRDLLDSQPAFDLFFSGNRIFHVLEAFSVNQAIELVVFAEF